MTAATVIHDVGHQALDLEQKARMMAEAARKEAESARNIAMEVRMHLAWPGWLVDMVVRDR